MSGPPRGGDAPDLADTGRRDRAWESRRHGDHIPKPFVVVIVAGHKRGTWGSFATLDSAVAVASKLRRHGFNANVTDQRGVAP